jgi:hypothetical protein
MTGKPGVYLTPEQSLRLALVDSLDRDALIAGIAAHLRRAARPVGRDSFYRRTPRDWYSTSLGGRARP